MQKLPILILCLLLLPGRIFAAEGGVAVLFSADIAPYRQAFDGFREIVQQKKGGIAIVEHVLEKENPEKVARQIDSQKPLLVFTVGPEAAKFAGTNLHHTPLIFSMVLRPQSLAAPNVTWVSLEIPARARLEKIRKLLPGVRNIGVIYSPDSDVLYREIARECHGLGLRAVGRQIESGTELSEAFADLAPRIDLFLMVADTRVFSPKLIQYLLAEALKTRLPVVGLAASYSRAGALLSFEADYRDIGRQAGAMALRIIDGENPASIKPATPRGIKTSLNLAVAKRLRISLDAAAVKEAAEVFK
jgi:putative ABC transport system substrate-binding protein